MEKKPYPSETQERFIIRLPDGMRDQISDEAKKNSRSMNAEIVARLAQSFSAESAELDQLRFENATLKVMLEGKSLGTDLAAILAVTLAGQTLGMIAELDRGKHSPREMASLKAFAELVLAKQPSDWPNELMRAYEATPSDVAGAKAKRELEVLRRIAQSLVTYYDSRSQAKRLGEIYDKAQDGTKR